MRLEYSVFLNTADRMASVFIHVVQPLVYHTMEFILTAYEGGFQDII